MTSAFEELRDARNRLISLLPASRSMNAFQMDHTEIMDQYFRKSLQESETGRRLFSKKVSFAFLAVGGYGREELSLHSDIDILILFGSKIPAPAKGLTEEVFYPLWDLGLELGYGTRTIKDCTKLCKGDFEVLTSMLDARFLCGDSNLYMNLKESLEKTLTPKRAAALGRWLEDRYQIRMDTYGDASFLLEPNLKDGIGGLRDYHHILWIAKSFFHLLTPRDLEYSGRLSHHEYQELQAHLDFIWIIRNQLHQLSDRRNDRLSFEYQEKIGRRLGYKDRKDLLSVEQFMGDLHTSMAAIKSLNRSFIRTHLLKAKAAARMLQPFEAMENLNIHQGEIGFDSATAILSNPLLLINIFEHSSHSGCPLSMEARRLVREFLFLVDDAFRNSKKATRSFLNIITGTNTFETLSHMLEVGFLGAFIPEFGKITNRVQFDAYHMFPVGRHALETVRHLKTVGHQKEMLLLDIFLELKNPEPLFLAGLFHDIGKVGKEHAIKGAEITAGLLKRFNYPKDITKDLLFLIEHHLFLVETATRRDLNDEKVVVQCACRIANVERLQMLYLLTWADSKATGPGTWNEWTSNLVQELFFKTLNILAGGELATVDVSQKVDQTMAQVRDLMSHGGNPEEMDQFFEVMSPRYLSAEKPREIIRHIEMARNLKEGINNPEACSLSLEARKNDLEDCFEITVLANDRPGLFSDIAGVLALNNINVLSSDIYTWRDGTAVDIFRVTDPPDPINPDKTWRRVQEGLKRVFTGKLSLAYRLGQKGTSSILAEDKKPSQPFRVIIDNRSSDFFTLIEVFANDRVGLLYLITKTLFDLRLDIRIAKIATKGDQIADVFYVRDLEGQKIEDGAHLREIEAALRYELTRF